MNGKSQHRCKKCKHSSIIDNNDRAMPTLYCDKTNRRVKALGFNESRHYSVSPKWCPLKNM